MMFPKAIHPLQRRSRTHRAFCAVTDTCRDHFLPHTGNDHVPHVLRHRTLFGYAFILVLLKVFLVVSAISLPGAVLFSAAITPENIISLTNQSRAALGLGPLASDARLQEAARLKAEDMLKNQYFAHTSPYGITPWVWFAKAGYTYRVAGENLAVHFTTAEAVTAGWMASSSHKANIVDPRYKHIGVGVVEGVYEGYDTTFVVQLFGLPKDEPAVESVPVAQVEETVEPPQLPEPVETGEQVAGVETDVEPEEVIPMTPVIQESQAKILPKDEGYVVSVPVMEADEVKVVYAGHETPLQEDVVGSWSGAIPISETPSEEEIVIVASNEVGVEEEEIAVVSPLGTFNDVYSVVDTPEQKIFGVISVSKMMSLAQSVYVGVLALIFTALTVAVIAWSDRQKWTVIAHSLGILLLGLFLSVI